MIFDINGKGKRIQIIAVIFQFPPVQLPEGINFLSQVLCATYQRIMFHLPEDRHVPLPEDRMWFSQRIVHHFPEDSAFFPEDRMRLSQRTNVHLPEDRLFHFPKSYFHSLRGYSK